MACLYNGILCENEHDWITTTCNIIGEGHKQCWAKESHTKGWVLDDSICMKFRDRDCSCVVTDKDSGYIQEKAVALVVVVVGGASQGCSWGAGNISSPDRRGWRGLHECVRLEKVHQASNLGFLHCSVCAFTSIKTFFYESEGFSSHQCPVKTGVPSMRNILNNEAYSYKPP